jgi:hypothetical protein
MPELKASDAAPDDVKSAVDKVNASTDAMVAAQEKVPGIKDKTMTLKDKVAAFPGKVDSDLVKKNDLKITDLPKVMSKTKTNVSITASTPDRVADIGKEIEDYVTSLKSAFTTGDTGSTSATATSSSTTKEGASSSSASTAKEKEKPIVTHTVKPPSKKP